MPTVRDLVQQLSLHDPDAEVVFESGEGGVLTYYRVKGRGPKVVQIEFDVDTRAQEATSIVREEATSPSLDLNAQIGKNVRWRR
ncbi:MAG: hypothetical protein RIC56_03780 [Pseudomonadales bacterium]